MDGWIKSCQIYPMKWGCIILYCRVVMQIIIEVGLENQLKIIMMIMLEILKTRMNNF